MQKPDEWVNSMPPNRLRHRIPTYLQAAATSQLMATDYRRSVRREMAKRARRRHSIYLDVNWWIRVRKACFSTPYEDENWEVARCLLALVRDEIAICLPSGTCIDELLKQLDRTSRVATAWVMDELSSGVGLASKEQQAIYELAYWLGQQDSDGESIERPELAMLTYPAYTLLEPTVSITGVPDAIARAMETSSEMMAAEMTYVETLMFISGLEVAKEEPNEVARAVNEAVKGKTQAKKPYDALVADEACGYARAFMPKFRSSGLITQLESAWNGVEVESEIGRRIRSALADPDQRDAAPAGMRVVAALQAAIRVNRERRFKRGDADDVFHASCAIPYCDSFFTERSLKHLLTTRPVKDAIPETCTILADREEILEHLHQLRADATGAGDSEAE